MIPIPSITDTLASTTSGITQLTTYLLPLVVLTVALIVGGVIAVAFKRGIVSGVKRLAGGSRRRGGRRGRR